MLLGMRAGSAQCAEENYTGSRPMLLPQRSNVNEFLVLR
jgi:hypothetical protein